MSTFLPVFIVLFICLVIFILLAVYVLWDEHKKKRESEPQGRNEPLSEPAAQGYTILQEAQHEANKILGEAELAGIRTVTEKKYEVSQYEKTFENDLKEMAKQAVNQLVIATDSLTKRYEQFVSESENIIAYHLSQNQKVLDQQYETIIAKNKEILDSFFSERKEEIAKTIDQSIKETKGLIKAYQDRREALVDEHIVDIVQKTTLLTIQKTLSPEDHTELIVKSLEEAKREGIFEDKKKPNN